jgi:ankyrin repeat protein
VPLEILIKHDASTNVQNNAGQTPLHLACSRSFKPGVEALLKAGADPNIMDLEKRKAHNFAHKKDIRDLLQAREKTTFTLAPITTSGKPASAASASAAPATTAAATGGSIFLADMSMAVNLDDDDGDDDDEPEEDDD